jgi:hypothetical protein
MRREIKRLLEELEAADLTPGQVAAKRLRYDILDKERDRLEGKPYTKAEPPKQSIGVINRALDQVNSIFAQIDATSTKALTSSERSNGVALFQPDAEPARSTSSERLDAVEIAVREALAADDIDLIYGNILLSQTQKQQAAAEYQRRPREVS